MWEIYENVCKIFEKQMKYERKIPMENKNDLREIGERAEKCE